MQASPENHQGSKQPKTIEEVAKLGMWGILSANVAGYGWFLCSKKSSTWLEEFGQVKKAYLEANKKHQAALSGSNTEATRNDLSKAYFGLEAARVDVKKSEAKIYPEVVIPSALTLIPTAIAGVISWKLSNIIFEQKNKTANKS